VKRLFLLGGCLLIALMMGAACLLTLLISNDAQSLLVQSAGFEKQQGDIASFWIIRATVIVKYSPTEIAVIESNAVPLDPPAENAALAEIAYPYADFLSISSDLNGAPVAIYRASEADFLMAIATNAPIYVPAAGSFMGRCALLITGKISA